jgi:hypothetical protein
MSTNPTTELRLILAMAPSFQGGHSKMGGEVADYLGIPFPLSVTHLRRKALACGLKPYDLWPWLKEIEDRRRAFLAAKRTAPSDKMFNAMAADYERAIERERKEIYGATDSER